MQGSLRFPSAVIICNRRAFTQEMRSFWISGGIHSHSPGQWATKASTKPTCLSLPGLHLSPAESSWGPVTGDRMSETSTGGGAFSSGLLGAAEQCQAAGGCRELSSHSAAPTLALGYFSKRMVMHWHSCPGAGSPRPWRSSDPQGCGTDSALNSLFITQC